VLGLSGNQFYGSLPDSIGSLTNLVYVYLYDNRFTGTIPASIGNWTRAKNIYLNHCQLSGTLPATLAQLTSIQYFDVSENALTGSLPNLTALFSAEKQALAPWSLLRFDSNQLSGSLPPWLALYPGSQMGLQGNWFAGSLPPALLTAPFNAQYRLCSSVAECFTAVTLGPPIVPALGLYVAVSPPTVANVPGAVLIACSAGTFRSGVDSQFSGTLYYPAPICTPCPNGTIAPNPGATYCIPCPVNEYATGDGVHCTPCPEHSISLPGSTVLGNCSCEFRYAKKAAPVGAFTCSLCDAGTYFDHDTTSCLPCAPGFTSFAGAVACSQCLANLYSLNTSFCAECPYLSKSPAGTKNVSECKCPYGMYQDSSAGVPFGCSPCPEGGQCFGDAIPLCVTCAIAPGHYC
jgi:hypothetical protein